MSQEKIKTTKEAIAKWVFDKMDRLAFVTPGAVVVDRNLQIYKVETVADGMVCARPWSILSGEIADGEEKVLATSEVRKFGDAIKVAMEYNRMPKARNK